MKDVYYYSQPIDTWVRQVSEAIGLVGRGLNNDKIIEQIVEKCLELKISPIKYNQGAWYIGRTYCHESSPACDQCPVGSDCPKVGIR